MRLLRPSARLNASSSSPILSILRQNEPNSVRNRPKMMDAKIGGFYTDISLFSITTDRASSLSSLTCRTIFSSWLTLCQSRLSLGPPLST